MLSPGIISVLLATTLAQAEPAPAETRPAGAAPPAIPAPPTGPAEPAPVEPPSPSEPAGAPPPATPPPSEPSPSAAPPNTAALLAGFAYRPSASLEPTVGFSLGGSFQRRYGTLASVLEVGWAFDFFFDRFSTAADATVVDAAGIARTVASTRTITDSSFAAMQTLGTHAGAWRLWLGAGGGLSIGFLSGPDGTTASATANAYQPFARAAAAAELAISDSSAVGLRAGYTFMLTTSGPASATGETSQLVGDLLDIQVGLFYRFR
jgi:hypothetical protein